jgi:hypothetical protein
MRRCFQQYIAPWLENIESLSRGPVYAGRDSQKNLNLQKVLARILQNRNREAILLPMGSTCRVANQAEITDAA